jgi:UrcA family protein
MNTNATVRRAIFSISLAAAAACALPSGIALADARFVTVAIPVSGVGLDLGQPAGARKLYRRLQIAATIACGKGDQVGLEPVQNLSECYEKALADAVRRVNRPQLSVVYLATHTSRDAAKYDIEVPAQVAAK